MTFLLYRTSSLRGEMVYWFISKLCPMPTICLRARGWLLRHEFTFDIWTVKRTGLWNVEKDWYSGSCRRGYCKSFALLHWAGTFIAEFSVSFGCGGRYNKQRLVTENGNGKRCMGISLHVGYYVFYYINSVNRNILREACREASWKSLLDVSGGSDGE